MVSWEIYLCTRCMVYFAFDKEDDAFVVFCPCCCGSTDIGTTGEIIVGSIMANKVIH